MFHKYDKIFHKFNHFAKITHSLLVLHQVKKNYGYISTLLTAIIARYGFPIGMNELCYTRHC